MASGDGGGEKVGAAKYGGGATGFAVLPPSKSERSDMPENDAGSGAASGCAAGGAKAATDCEIAAGGAAAGGGSMTVMPECVRTTATAAIGFEGAGADVGATIGEASNDKLCACKMYGPTSIIAP